MNRFRFPFILELSLALAFSVLVLMCCDNPPGISVDIENGCSDNIKLCKVCDHVIPGDAEKNWLTLTESQKTDFFEIWRQDRCLAKFNVTGEKFPDEPEEGEPPEIFNETIVIGEDLQDIADPFDDIFYATPLMGYVSVTSGKCP